MAGLISAARFKELAPDSTLTGEALLGYLAAAQGVAESLTGLVFGAEITAVQSLGGNQYKLTVGSPLGDPGARVRLIGGGVSATPFEIKDCARGWITVESASPITTATTKALPVIEHVGEPMSGIVYVQGRPIFGVVSVQTRYSTDVLWTSDEVKTLDSTQYELVTGRYGMKVAVRIQSGTIPKRSISESFLVKRMAVVAEDCVRVTYAAGYFSAVPADLEMAAMELVSAFASSVEEGGALASESFDYYSYQRLTYDQLGAVPSSALATFQRYRDV